MLENAGFVDVSISPEAKREAFIRGWDHALDLSEFLVGHDDGREPTGYGADGHHPDSNAAPTRST